MSEARPTSGLARLSLLFGLASFGIALLYTFSQVGFLLMFAVVGALVTLVAAFLGLCVVFKHAGKCRGFGSSIIGGGLAVIGLVLSVGVG